MAGDFRELLVWQKAMVLVKGIYAATQRLPADERFGLTSQIRRAAVSIPANIAEGQGRHTASAFINHLGIARGSLLEVETLLLLVDELYPDRERIAISDLTVAIGEIKRMLNGLMAALDKDATT